eukprot:10533915-Alexandrium_andersonii.AAC.1
MRREPPHQARRARAGPDSAAQLQLGKLNLQPLRLLGVPELALERRLLPEGSEEPLQARVGLLHGEGAARPREVQDPQLPIAAHRDALSRQEEDAVVLVGRRHGDVADGLDDRVGVLPL